MKKVLSYILISLIIAVNFLAPISVGVNQNKIEVKQQKAFAEDGGIKMTVIPGSSDTTIKLLITVTWSILSGTREGVKVILKDTTGVEANREKIVDLETVKDNTQKGNVYFENLTPDKQYSVITEARQIAGISKNNNGIVTNINALIPDSLGLWEIKGESFDTYSKEGSLWNLIVETTNESTKTQIAGKTNLLVGKEQTSQNMQFDDTMPACDILGDNGTFMGCVAQGFYYVLFVPTSYLFALSGIFFDNTFAYSVQDSSYRSAFVVQGWGLVRDFCNMFFIFIMLYVAIGTILSLHTMKTKETIINVVIIGLFINFSLFATQVIIDASNITARVFYNSDAIKITQKGQSDNTVKNATDGGTILAEETVNGVIPLSAALVNKVNPQNIIINSKKVNAITVKGGSGSVAGEDKENIGVGSFILIVILAAAVNIVGLIVFLSVGLIFVSRVIGLWIAMILAPLAFFTYILPEMAGTKMIGWKNWWPETLKLAFLAPVFIFFLYIILKFLELDIITDIVNKGGLDFFVATLIPFAFIMILMLRAKSIASDMSGEMGQKITGGVAAAGGMLLGGAALGTAFLGRRVVGAGIASMSRTEDSMKRSTAKIKFNAELEKWKHADPATRNPTAPKWSDHAATAGISEKTFNPITLIGSKLNEKQAKVNMLDHATHEIEEAKKTAHIVDAKGETLNDGNMSGQDEIELEKAFNKNKRSDVETNLRKGLNATGKAPGSIADSTGHQYEGEEAYKKAKRGQIETAYINDAANGVTGGVASLTDKDKKNIENELNKQFNVDLSEATKTELEGLFHHIRDESRQGVNMLTRGFARSNKASYDARNLSEVKAGKHDGFLNKIPTAMIAGVALGVRSGLKSSGINHGQGQGDALKDIGATITEALKGIKVEVPKAASGGHGGGHDAHAPAGGGHH